MSGTPEEFTTTIRASSDDPYKEATLRDEHTVYSDEPEWTAMPGDDAYPSPGDYLLLSLAACQVSVLDQCLKKNGVTAYRIDCDARIDSWQQETDVPDEMPATTGLRIEHVTVDMELRTTPEYEDRADRCLTVYDEGCVIGQSIGVAYTPTTRLVVDEALGGSE